ELLVPDRDTSVYVLPSLSYGLCMYSNFAGPIGTENKSQIVIAPEGTLTEPYLPDPLISGCSSATPISDMLS
ncbi:hypothetical protein, partial [Enterococcus faecium]|uniref:hypothetical protein n=1 Tax=Enterococcus faecium TaxID=1352 RepID=UPI0013759841